MIAQWIGLCAMGIEDHKRGVYGGSLGARSLLGMRRRCISLLLRIISMLGLGFAYLMGGYLVFEASFWWLVLEGDGGC